MRDEPTRGFLGSGHYWPAKIEAARRLRRDATQAERVAWALLRRNAMRGHYFRRQQVVEGFIVDFFCAKLRLVIEIDGEVHDSPDQAEYDQARDELLRTRGLRIVRIGNEGVSRGRLKAIVIEHENTPPPTGGGAGEGA